MKDIRSFMGKTPKLEEDVYIAYSDELEPLDPKESGRVFRYMMATLSERSDAGVF